MSTILKPSLLSIVRIISTYNNKRYLYKNQTRNLTSFNRPGKPGRQISAIPSQITAVSSTKTPSGNDSSAGNSITSRPSFLQQQQNSSHIPKSHSILP
jgi:hypothetical protein